MNVTPWVLELRTFKDSVTNFETHSSFVRQILTSWTIKSRIVLQEWKDIAHAILDLGHISNGSHGREKRRRRSHSTMRAKGR